MRVMRYICIAKWVASSGRVPKGSGSILGGAKVVGTDGICKYFTSFGFILLIVLINLQHCGQPWR